VVQPPKTSKEVAALASEATLVVLDPTAESALIDLPLPEVGRIEIVVGPEGGISEQELQMFDQAGAKRVHMGSGILRTSTAGVAAIAFLAGRQGLWR
jgi:16S rRNA (uracil1498-N3)-methyltransferase